jgi:inosose dehydratase
VPLAFHHHMATAIETERDLDLLMRHTGEAVGLLYDAGTCASRAATCCARSRTTAAHRPRPRQGRARAVIANLDRERRSFLDAVLEGAFTVPGDGAIDFPAVVRRLADQGYEGWFVVEAEQDPAKAPAGGIRRIGHRAMAAALTQAGYRIEGPPS